MLKRLGAIVEKEFIIMARDRGTLVLILSLPLIQLILFAYAIHMDVKHIPLAVADQSLDSASRSYLDDLVHSDYFDVVSSSPGQDGVIAAIDSGEARVGVVIPPDFLNKVNQGDASVLLIVDGSDPFTTQSAYNTANVIAQEHTVHLALERLAALGKGSVSQMSNPLTAHIHILYNPNLDDLWFLVPGLIAMLLQTQTITLTALAVVREREAGTIEQILVTPIRPAELMLGKTIPNLLIAFINTLTIVVVGALWFGVSIKGNLPLFFVLTILYMFSGLGLGLLISSLSQNQRQAQQLTTMITFIGQIIGGFVFPRYAMPEIMQWLSNLFPLTYFIPISRGIYMKGIGMEFLTGQVVALAVYTVAILFFSARLFRQRLD
ncbi:MAG: ABC transporter permease [Anaerolineales bacterium]